MRWHPDRFWVGFDVVCGASSRAFLAGLSALLRKENFIGLLSCVAFSVSFMDSVLALECRNELKIPIND